MKVYFPVEYISTIHEERLINNGIVRVAPGCHRRSEFPETLVTEHFVTQ
jgi:hypothetical protein